MANQEHLDLLLNQGVDVWNTWRKEHPEVQPDLRKANFSQANLMNVNLNEADLTQARLDWVNLSFAHLTQARLIRANLTGAHLHNADLSDANLSRANLGGAVLVGTNLTRATLNNCSVYGVSAWGVKLREAKQENLIITPEDEPAVTVDNLEVAQFIYLLLNNPKIREVIDTIGQKGVLILGRFSKDRKPILDALRKKLRTLDYVPIVFDFERPLGQDFTETVKILAGLSCFVIADITNPKSSPLELQATVPDFMIPFVPIIQKGEKPFSMFVNLRGKYNWILKPLAYDTSSNLIKVLERAVVKPALEKRKELLAKKVEQLQITDIEDLL